jgi:hypothetical protein
MRFRILSDLLLASLPLVACSSAGEPPMASPEAPHAAGTISGAIRDGNRPPPALRVCAHPQDGSKPTCMEVASGATTYRMQLTPGRYVVVAMAKDDPGQQFAHASRIRCIRAPCPPDALIEVELAAGETLTGIDLTAGPVQPISAVLAN